MNEDLGVLRRSVHEVGLQIALDGPAGAGKSTMGRALAAALACPFVDTGLMYRAVTARALSQSIRPSDELSLERLANELDFDVNPEGLLIDKEPAPPELHSPEVDRIVSEVSAHPLVRRVLVRRQRDLANEMAIVMVGRDIGTTVLPAAPIKIWVTASDEERARRRHVERPADGGNTADDVLRGLQLRDLKDAGRMSSPLRQPVDAVVIATDRLTPAQSLEKALTAVVDALERFQVDR